MQLNVRYGASKYPIQDLNPGTIVEVYFPEKFSDENKDLIVIIDDEYNISDEDGQKIYAVSVKNGGTYTESHNIQEYIIKVLK